VKLTGTSGTQTSSLDDCRLVFLGTGIRGGEPYIELQNYIKTAEFKAGVRFVLFMTWAGGGASNKLAYERVKLLLDTKGQRLEADYFICLGQTFGFTRRGRPNADDLDQAKNWAQQKL
jgi:hypothetical protein